MPKLYMDSGSCRGVALKEMYTTCRSEDINRAEVEDQYAEEENPGDKDYYEDVSSSLRNAVTLFGNYRLANDSELKGSSRGDR